MKRISLIAVALLSIWTTCGFADEGGLSPSRLSKLGLEGLDIAEGAAVDPAEELPTDESGDAPPESSGLSQVTRTIDPLRNLSLPAIENLLSPATSERAQPIAKRSTSPATVASEIANQVGADGDLKELDSQLALRRRQVQQAQLQSQLATRAAGAVAARRLALQNEIARLKRELAAAGKELEEKTLAARVAAAQLARQQSALEEAAAEKSAAEKRDTPRDGTLNQACLSSTRSALVVLRTKL